jgi:hypothetical protein
MSITRAISTRFFRMDAGARRWLRKTAMKNYWRVALWISLDDLIQDGELCWMTARRRYSEANPAQLMALFKTIYTNHLHDLANDHTLQSLEIPFTSISDTKNLDELLDGEPCPYAELLRLVTEAPGRVNHLLGKLLADPTPLRAAYRRDGYVRETTNERLCALTGLDPVSVDLHTAVRGSLSH